MCIQNVLVIFSLQQVPTFSLVFASSTLQKMSPENACNSMSTIYGDRLSTFFLGGEGGAQGQVQSAHALKGQGQEVKLKVND